MGYKKMENLKVRDLLEPTYTKVKDILPGKCGYNLIVKVVTKNVLIDIVRLDTTRVVIADFVIGDETGIVKMRLRNENFVDIIKEGQTIIIRNCKVPIVNQHMRMQVDAFGKIENCLDHHISEVNKEKDLSEVVYDNYSSKKRGGDRGNNSQYDRSNYSQSNFGGSSYGGNHRQYRDNNFSSMGGDTASVNTFLSSQMGR